MSKSFKIALTLLLFLVAAFVDAKNGRIVVSTDGKGNFNSIQAAIESLSDSATEPRVIFIKKGIYKEKIYIEKHNIVLEGEDKDGVIITAAIAREEWRCKHADDWGVATLNIDGNDITLKNLTVINSFGFDFVKDKVVSCNDTATPFKTINRTGHQMAVRTMAATRFAAINCVFRSYAGDTMSPWNVKAGAFYFKGCLFEGGVDLYCPRGWAYAEDCKIIASRADAAIWHDGSAFEDSKTVLNRCSFEGYDGFKLGRYHRDAQFYLLNCTFASNMANKPIYRVETNNVIKWGERVYYYNCHKIGEEYAWYANNLPASVTSAEVINAQWVFGDKWAALNNLQK